MNDKLKGLIQKRKEWLVEANRIFREGQAIDHEIAEIAMEEAGISLGDVLLSNTGIKYKLEQFQIDGIRDEVVVSGYGRIIDEAGGLAPTSSFMSNLASMGRENALDDILDRRRKSEEAMCAGVVKKLHEWNDKCKDDRR
jgi:hypothetical protein